MAVYSSQNIPIAIIEFKNLDRMDENFAIQFRKNMILENNYFTAPFFLLLSQNIGFLWKNSGLHPEEPPTISFSVKEIIEKYFPTEDKDKWLSKPELEMVIFGWLMELSYLREIPESKAEKILADNNFLQAIKGAHVQMGVSQ